MPQKGNSTAEFIPFGATLLLSTEYRKIVLQTTSFRPFHRPSEALRQPEPPLSYLQLHTL